MGSKVSRFVTSHRLTTKFQMAAIVSSNKESNLNLINITYSDVRNPAIGGSMIIIHSKHSAVSDWL